MILQKIYIFRVILSFFERLEDIKKEFEKMGYRVVEWERRYENRSGVYYVYCIKESDAIKEKEIEGEDDI